jgi:tRNA threonylcarbamoyladenosine biosynthesis protein TsaB
MVERDEIPFPLLLTDCSAPGVRAGILGDSGWMAYQQKDGETGSVLFETVKQLLFECRLSLQDIRSFAYCEGPGSTLGIRINAMALRTWNQLTEIPRPIYAYRSLGAAAVLRKQNDPGAEIFAVLSDLRKDFWNGLKVDSNKAPGTIGTVTAKELESWPGQRFFIQQRIHSPGLPKGAAPLDYHLESMPAAKAFPELLRPVDQPTVFQTTQTTFKQWTPSRHR